MEQPKVSSAVISVLPDPIRKQERLAVFLALVAGYIDAAGLIKWKTYVSFMSGNTTQLGAALSADKSGVVITSVTVIGFFLLGIYTGICLSVWKRMKNQELTFYIVSGILIFYTIISYFYTINSISSIAMIGFSMGLMNTIVTSVGNQKINTDFVTGTLNSLARNTAMLSMTKNKAEKEEYKSNAIHLLLLWIGFLSGAFTAPSLLGYLGKWTFILPAVLLLMCGLLISKINYKNSYYVTEK
ncbi:YoaK family protein [Chryseobacterium gregarium]|uniref:YoaK family protein n=1 Tax=Chryseobacterium gregarium TaxID=456299 RepID=UPI00042097D7|nr:YoaK family protein [Chryseobacterium gregarium]